VKKYYKIFEDKDGLPHTLFHGVRGSRTLSLDEWIEAEHKLVNDGGTEYESGFHVFSTLEKASEYLVKRFTNMKNKVISAVWVQGPTREKTHSNAPILLADFIDIEKADWDKRIEFGWQEE
jgi:hypothetical protein